MISSEPRRTPTARRSSGATDVRRSTREPPVGEPISRSDLELRDRDGELLSTHGAVPRRGHRALVGALLGTPSSRR